MKNKIYAILISAFVVWLSSLIFKTYKRKFEIEDSGETIIGKYVLCKSYPKTGRHYFIININYKYYKLYSSKNLPADFKNNIGKFYRIKYLRKYPDIIFPIFESAVIDTSVILNSGFTDKMLDKNFRWKKVRTSANRR
ncbi:hypothetical protein [Flavobacterium selenitireducens]|uniref:hypothetical protein n=1 Tax=Flavobacterium selenitireducens TaxID=2722704 RepID=UPI00168AEAD8|nr:hypothetical protein [Flavobacterium selenitireducens]MBD3583914.1 hypothetical protein [Flavobacterium selenitireducens]